MDTTATDELARAIVQAMEAKPQTVEQLVTLVRERRPASEQDVIQSIQKLQREGRIQLSNQRGPSPLRFSAYMKTGGALWFWVTLATAAATIAVLFTIPEDLYPWVYVRYSFGAIFALWLPGYTFVKALFPPDPSAGLSERSPDRIERFALSLGMSLALVPIVGLLLNYTPWGIRLVPLTLSLLTLTLVLATTAIIRAHHTRKATYPS